MDGSAQSNKILNRNKVLIIIFFPPVNCYATIEYKPILGRER